MKIVHAGHPALRKPAARVAEAHFGGEQLQHLIDEMVAAMRAAPGVGLAAPQLGVELRVLVIEDTAERMSHLTEAEKAERARTDVPLLALVNPVLEHASEEQDTFFEGCLSVPGYSALVPRAHEVTVSGFSPKGEPVRLEASGWPARILQHELDHLDGRLYVDRMHSRSFATADEARVRFSGRSIAEIAIELGLVPAAP